MFRINGELPFCKDSVESQEGKVGRACFLPCIPLVTGLWLAWKSQCKVLRPFTQRQKRHAIICTCMHASKSLCSTHMSRKGIVVTARYSVSSEPGVPVSCSLLLPGTLGRFLSSMVLLKQSACAPGASEMPDWSGGVGMLPKSLRDLPRRSCKWGCNTPRLLSGT